MRESDILYQVGPAWIMADRKRARYVVFVDGNVYAVSDSAYALTTDGLSIARARVDYLGRKHEKNNL